MFQNLTGWHFVILLVIILLLFGAPRLPALARSLGQSFRILKGEVKQAKHDDETQAPAPTQASAPETTQPGSTAPTVSDSQPTSEAPSLHRDASGEPGDQTPRP